MRRLLSLLCVLTMVLQVVPIAFAQNAYAATAEASNYTDELFLENSNETLGLNSSTSETVLFPGHERNSELSRKASLQSASVSVDDLFLKYPTYLNNDYTNAGFTRAENACYAVLNSYSAGDSALSAAMQLCKDGIILSVFSGFAAQFGLTQSRADKCLEASTMSFLNEYFSLSANNAFDGVVKSVEKQYKTIKEMYNAGALANKATLVNELSSKAAADVIHMSKADIEKAADKLLSNSTIKDAIKAAGYTVDAMQITVTLMEMYSIEVEELESLLQEISACGQGNSDLYLGLSKVKNTITSDPYAYIITHFVTKELIKDLVKVTGNILWKSVATPVAIAEAFYSFLANHVYLNATANTLIEAYQQMAFISTLHICLIDSRKPFYSGTGTADDIDHYLEMYVAYHAAYVSALKTCYNATKFDDKYNVSDNCALLANEIKKYYDVNSYLEQCCSSAHAQKQSDTPVLSISNATTPNMLERGSSFNLEGVITTSVGKITQVFATIYNSKEIVQSHSVYPNSISYNLNNKVGTTPSIDSSLVFGRLPAGSYTYTLWAKATNGSISSSATLLIAEFTVGSYQPTFTIRNETRPSSLETGKIFNLYGVISTDNGVLTSVSGKILSSSGYVLQEHTVYPNAKSYDINTKVGSTASINTMIAFEVLPVGTYVYSLSATAKNGSFSSSKEIIHAVFTVEKPQYVTGKCGNDLTWSYYRSGFLTISGSGEMFDYDLSTSPPWYSFRDDIDTVIIEYGVSGIGDYAFGGISDLSYVSIPNSVTSIGAYAFANCEALSAVTLPIYLTDIGNCAFWHCSKLTSIALPDCVRNIGASSFYQCDALERIRIPGSVVYIGAGAFLSKGMKEISVDPNNYDFSSLDGVLYSIGKTRLIQYPAGNERTSFVLPISVTKIENYAFAFSCPLNDVYYYAPEDEWNGVVIGSNNAALSNVTLHFNPYAMYSGKCGTNLSWELNADNGILRIFGNGEMDQDERYDFDGSPWDQYKEYIKTVYIEEGVTSVGKCAFYDHENLINVSFPSTLDTIGSNAFNKCSSLEAVVLPDSIQTIMPYAFAYCRSLTGIRIPDSTTTLAGCAFTGCTALEDISIGCGITTISTSCFWACSALKELIIPEGITIIGGSAFSSCDSLISVSIPASVASIENSAFSHCSKLTDVYYYGTPEQWERLIAELTSSALLNATVHFAGSSIYPDQTEINCDTDLFIGLDSVRLTWDSGKNATDYTLLIYRLGINGIYTEYQQIDFAESGLSLNLQEGNYRAVVLSVNRQSWLEEPVDGLHYPTAKSEGYEFSVLAIHKITFDANEGELDTAVESCQISEYNNYEVFIDNEQEIALAPVGLYVYTEAGAAIGVASSSNSIVVNEHGMVIQFRGKNDNSILTVPQGGYVIVGYEDQFASMFGRKNAFGFVANCQNSFVGIDDVTNTVYRYRYNTENAYLSHHKTVADGESYSKLPVPTHEGYTFDGWYTAKVGGIKITEESIYSVSTLYAHWVEDDRIAFAEKPVLSNGKVSVQISAAITEPTEIIFAVACYDISGKMIGVTMVTQTVNGNTASAILDYPEGMSSEDAASWKVLLLDAESFTPLCQVASGKG